MKKTHIALLVFLVMALAAIIALVYEADTYATFTEAKQHPDREFNIIGTLEASYPIEELIVDNTLLLSFYMSDSEGTKALVNYFGAKPTDFEKSEQVVLVGSYDDDVFIASSLLLKCPSKYNPDEMDEKIYTATE